MNAFRFIPHLTLSRSCLPVRVAVVLTLMWSGVFAQEIAAQQPSGPIEITADSLEVDDIQKTAVFTGSVVVKQADAVMTTPNLTVFYKDTGAQTQARGELGALNSGSQDIDKLEAQGPVVVTQKDQTAQGDFGVFDAASEIITLTGRVVLKQGENIIKGQQLIVNLKTQQSRIVSGQGQQGRVRAIITPGETPSGQVPSPL